MNCQNNNPPHFKQHCFSFFRVMHVFHSKKIARDFFQKKSKLDLFDLVTTFLKYFSLAKEIFGGGKKALAVGEYNEVLTILGVFF